MNENTQNNNRPARVPEAVRDAVRLVAAALRRAKERRLAAEGARP